MQASKMILMFVGDYVEDYEAMFPFQALTMLGYIVHTVSPGKQAGETVKTAIHDFEKEQTYSEKPGHKLLLTATFDTIEPHRYAGLVIPGGRSPEYLRLNERVLEITRYFFVTNRPVAVTCHGPQILIAAGVLKGRLCTGYPGLKPDLILAGAIWGEVDETLSNVYVDGNLVSCASWRGNPEWMRQFVRLLTSKSYGF
ncbi:protease I [Thermanaeromonas toyohensis ToBE]|uniref:Protease I n=1 Tax=Thermanaeromonas toyohensis ToBE TaxID=698762 RepID=A0A1W1VDX8_9FIRM|nr:DJ-1/PfpI family protein [Thermanaeromonas toyohensis]SMB91582.1 protease I [Thermanaeromonas toyohensis ToBE]